MPGFRLSSKGTTGWLLWIGDPDYDQAHQTILDWLRPTVAAFLDPATPLSNRAKGNLGEFITYCIGKHYAHPTTALAYTANAWDPLGNMSRPGPDIKWLNLGQNPNEDWITIQEVKTTGDNSLALASDLITDYNKLFGQDLKLTLRTRLTHLKNRLDQEGRTEMAPRITELGGPSPAQSHGVYLVPTLLHDALADSSTRMAAVRRAIIEQGWPAGNVECWSIQLETIDTRLNQISRGQ